MDEHVQHDLTGSPKGIKLVIAGSREHDNEESEEVIKSWLDEQLDPERIEEVVSGTCRGPDTFGEEWAESNRIPVTRFPADWDEHGKSAGPIRNTEMAEYADALVAFPVPSSSGTRDMIRKAEKQGLNVKVVTVHELELHEDVHHD